MPFSRGPPNPGFKPVSLASPALAGGFMTPSTTWEACGLSNQFTIQYMKPSLQLSISTV